MSGTTESTTTRTDLTATGRTGLGDSAFRILTLLAGLVVLGILVVVAGELLVESVPNIAHEGVSFLWKTQWSTRLNRYGALPFVTGTVMTSALALLLAGPVSLGIAVLLTQYLRGVLREVFVFLVELVAGIPSVIYGLWGLLFFSSIVTNYVTPAIRATPLTALPFFGPVGASSNMLLASLVLALMITPIISSFSRESLVRVPQDQRDAGVALGLTRWEVITGVVIPYARAGIVSAVILGLGRAIGETMAVTMLIGNTQQVTVNYFDPAATMSSLLANSFNQTSNPLANAALFEVGLVLFLVAFVVNSVARAIISSISHEGSR